MLAASSRDPGRAGAVGEGPSPWTVGRNYQLFRYMLGCNAYGDFPTKFNGGLFTVDPEITPQNDRVDRTPDFRAWGGGSITAQNQRLVHFPMLPAGDSDLLEPQLEFYLRALPGARLRTRRAWGHGGASFTEQIENYGLPCGNIYEADWGGRGVEPRPLEVVPDVGELVNLWCADEWDTVLEFALIALDRLSYSGRELGRHLEWIDEALIFFDEHYRMRQRDRTGGESELDAGYLVIFPGSANEMYKRARDATPTVLGLAVVLDRLLDQGVGTDEQRARWVRMRNTVPEPAHEVRDGTPMIAPARSWEYVQNEEHSAMYAVWPWERYGIGLADLHLAEAAYDHGADAPLVHGVHGWKQDPIWLARMGRTSEAAEAVLEKFDDAPRRFPAFWGPHFDWIPDHNHGGSAMIALQSMVLIPRGDRLLLFPAWPTDWDVDVKIHAPQQTVVEASVRGGVVVDLVVNPADRRADVECHLPLEVSVG